jgi:hypothetical protein
MGLKFCDLDYIVDEGLSIVEYILRYIMYGL